MKGKKTLQIATIDSSMIQRVINEEHEISGEKPHNDWAINQIIVQMEEDGNIVVSVQALREDHFILVFKTKI